MDELIKFETGKLAKTKGLIPQSSSFLAFDSYLKEGNPNHHVNYNFYSVDSMTLDEIEKAYKECDAIYCITQSGLQKWLRDIHNLHIWILPRHITIKDKPICLFSWIINSTKDSKVSYADKHTDIGFTTYEECIEDALVNGLNLIK